MATNTYIEIDKVTVETATPSITFNSIPSTYTDLVIVASFKASSTTIVTPSIRFNGDTNTNYSNTSMYSNASTMTSYRWTNTNKAFLGDFYAGVSNNAFIPYIININNYSNSSTYKTILCGYSQINSSNAEIGKTAAMWRNTNAITSVTITSDGGQNFAVGSTFSLYGIKAWTDETTTKATGGYVYSDSSYWYHAFPFSGTFTPSQSISADILVIAGGGCGGGNQGTANVGRGGGGGAGGLVYLSSQSLTATGYSITVGAGGADNVSYPGTNASGSNSQFGSLTAATGGGGGGVRNGGNGGSGGGAGTISGAGTAGTGTSGQGNNGGGATEAPNQYGSGGGGGAGVAGSTGTAIKGGDGGNGVNTYSSWADATGTGVNGYYAGGGGGAAYTDKSAIGIGGLGGGGNGAADFAGSSGNANAISATNGVVNTGSGGGGGTDYTRRGIGGSGIVIVRYAK